MNRFWGWYRNVCRYVRRSGGVGIVEIPSASSQMGPGGGWRLGPGSYVYDQTGLFEGSLSKEEKLVLLAAFTLVAGPLSIMRGGLMGVSAARTLVFLMLATSSGGGGPGGVLTSAVPPSITSGGAPPSAEGLGRLINSAHGGGRSGAKPRKRCPTGMVWSNVHKKCILDITWGTDQYSGKG